MPRTQDASDGQYSEQEAQQRFVAAVKAALNTPPQPMKDVPRKWSRAQRKQKRKAKRRAGSGVAN
jgi:hypothetical protein